MRNKDNGELMKRRGLVSVIMPSLNVAKYIEKCLESVITQTLDNIEIICVDAGSVDGTIEIIQKYASKDKRIRLIHSDTKSYGFQMNLGLDVAKGDYIGIVETDDYIQPEMFEKLYKAIVMYSVDYVKGGYTGFVGNEKTIQRKTFELNNKKYVGVKINLEENRKAGNYLSEHIWTGLYRKAFLDKFRIRFNETPGASYQDVSFSLLVGMLAESCVYINTYDYFYRMDNGQSSVKAHDKIDAVIAEYNYLVKRLEEIHRYSEEVKEIVFRHKIYTYHWNYSRLDGVSKKVFLDLICEEMSDLVTYLTYEGLSDREKVMVSHLTDEKFIDIELAEECVKRKELLALINRFIDGEKVNIVGAGKICESLVELVECLNLDFIATISDNSNEKQNEFMGGKRIISVERAALDYPNYAWLIANAKGYQDIQKQLCALGVDKKNIICMEQCIPMSIYNNYL